MATRRSAWRPLAESARAVALEVLIHGPLSRAELARRLGMSTPSLSRLTRPLTEAGLISETGDQQVIGRGRPSQPLAVIADAHHFLGINITGEMLYGALINLRAQVLTSSVMPLEDRDPDVVVSRVQQLIRQLTAGQSEVDALGVALGGNCSDGIVTRAPFLGWSGVPLGPMLHDRTGLPTVVGNDIAAFTEAEHWFGAGRDCPHFAVLTIGAGIGHGLVVHDRMVLSPDAGLGLIGHFPLEPGGPPCPLGHRGCATALLTTEAIESAISVALGRRLGYPECLSLAAAGNAAARSIVDEAARGLGRLVAATANLNMPRKIILSGEGIGLVDVARPALDAGIAADRDPDAAPLELAIRYTDFTQWARGAGVIALQNHVLGGGDPPLLSRP